MKKSFTLSKSSHLGRYLSATLLAACYLSSVSSLQAQTYTKTESFQNTTAPGFTLGGGALLTAPTTDAAGEGFLQLTSAAYQVGYTLDNTAFNSATGFSISFEYGSYGNPTSEKADGICAFLLDGATSVQNFAAGASGGSLGYAPQLSQNPATPGIPTAYLGVGFDDFGNFSNPVDGRVGGPGQVPNALVVRGAGNGTSGYAYLTGTALAFTVAGDGAARAPFVRADSRYRRAFITLAPAAVGYTLTVQIQHGTEMTTVLSDFAVSAPPATLRFGITGATGQNHSIYEIRNVTIQAGAVTSTSPSDNRAALALYPNPAADNLTLDMTKVPAGTYTVQLVDLLGRELYQQQLTGGALHQLDVESLAAGAYFVMVQGNKFKATLPVVHQ